MKEIQIIHKLVLAYLLFIYAIPSQGQGMTVHKRIVVNKNSDVRQYDNPLASKEETEAWIIDKLRQYNEVGRSSFERHSIVYSYKYHDFHFRISNGYLIVEFMEISSSIGRLTGTVTQEKNRNCTYIIPLYDIVRVSVNYRQIGIETGTKSILRMRDDDSEYYNYTSIHGFKENSEPELGKRFTAALLHLKNFYKKPLSREPF